MAPHLAGARGTHESGEHAGAEGAADVAQQAQRVLSHLAVVLLLPRARLGAGHVVADVLLGKGGVHKGATSQHRADVHPDDMSP